MMRVVRLTLATAVAAGAAGAAGAKPNIVFVMVDDWGHCESATAKTSPREGGLPENDMVPRCRGEGRGGGSKWSFFSR